jgi:hypothetical protein
MSDAGYRVMLVGSHDKERADCLTCTVTAVIPGEDNGLWVVKVKVSLAELIGPVQYIQQLEVFEISATKVTAVKNRGWV